MMRMPIIHIVLPRFRSSPPSLMAQKPNDDPTNDPKSMPLNAQTSILVFISAHAISYLGFTVSLLAIWFGWLLPASLTASAPSDTPDFKKTRPLPKHHRRSVSSSTRTTPSSNPNPVRRASAPVDLAPVPILVPHPEDNSHDSSKRVYFADSPSSPVTRRNTMPTPKKPNNFLAASICAISRNSSSSPSRPETPPNGCPDDPNAHDSDSSLTKPSRLQKIKLGFNIKTNHQHPSVDKQSDGDSVASIESDKPTAKGSRGGFVAAWSNSRVRAAGEDIDQGFASPSRLSFVRLLSPSTPTTTTTFCPPSPGSADITSPTTSRKERRSSTPIPRTHPYGAPYFASPPVLLDKNRSYPTYLKTLPQFEDDFSSARASDRGRESAIRRVALNPNRRVVCKRRSASEDWTVRPTTS